MYNLQSLAMVAAAVTTFSSVAYALDTSANTNMVVYWVRQSVPKREFEN